MSFGCKEAFERLDDYLDRELSAEEVAEVREHLEVCQVCASEFEFEAAVLSEIRRKLEHIDVPLELRVRVAAALRD